MIRTVVLDPLWTESGGGKIRRGANRHYLLMKTAAFLDLVEKRSVGPYLEIFARRTRENWTCWGNEVPVEEPAPEPDCMEEE